MPANPDDLKRADQLISEKQAEMEALFTSIGDGAITTDEFGKITRVNPKARQILGFSEKDMLGEWFPNIIVAVNEHNRPINMIDRPITKAFLTGRTISEKCIYRTKKGNPIPINLSVSPILIDSKPLGAIEVFRDITLEEEVDRMKSEFISLASHQLRTPLSAIKTYSHMLIEGYMGEVNQDQTKSLKTIIGATNRMNELISTLLNITRMESGTIRVSLKNIDINELVKEVIEEVSLLAKERNIEIKLSTRIALLDSIRSDPLLLKEILINLMTNAIKYTPQDGKIKLSAKQTADTVIFCVADSGWGIPEDVQDQIFSKFFRAQNIVKRETTGTGLGLYLVKGLVEALNGKIRFKSKPKQGTTFFVELPINPTKQ